MISFHNIFRRLDSTDPWAVLAVCTVYQISFVSLVFGLLLLRTGFDSGSISAIVESWDAHHYLFIAEHGYNADGDGRFFIVFLPLYPLLIRALTPISGSPYVAAFAISNLCSIGGHVLFLRMLGRLGFDSERSWKILLLMFASPVALYFCIVYTEGLYLFLLCAFFCLLYANRFPLAAAAGFLAAMTKVFGVYLAVAYYFYLLESRKTRLSVGSLLCGLAIPFGFLVYAHLNYAVFGDPLQFLSFQKENWHEELVNPVLKYLERMSSHLRGASSDYPTMMLGDIATMLALPLMALYAWRGRPRLPFHLWAWTAVNWILICSQSYWLSNIRYLGLLLPFYMMLEWAGSRSRLGYRSLLALFMLVSGYMLYLFVRGEWVA